jgi:excisionase family DNA binding protein
VFAKTPIEPNAIYTREETAQILGISLSTLKQLIRTGQLRVSQPMGLRRVFIRGTSILEMMEQSERQPVPLETNRLNDTYLSEHSLDSQQKPLRAKQVSLRARTGTMSKTARVVGGANR